MTQPGRPDRVSSGCSEEARLEAKGAVLDADAFGDFADPAPIDVVTWPSGWMRQSPTAVVGALDVATVPSPS